MDVQLFVSCEQDPCFDFEISNGDLSTANELNNAVMISLFTDKRAKDDDVLPSGQTDRRGWWADALDGQEIGSRLWLLYDERRLPKVLLRAEEYAKEALNWLITDKVAKSISITASMDGRCETLFLSVQICRPSNQTEKFKYQYVWDSLQGNNCHASEDYPYNAIPVSSTFRMRVQDAVTSDFQFRFVVNSGEATIDWGDGSPTVNVVGGTYNDGFINKAAPYHDYTGFVGDAIVTVTGDVSKLYLDVSSPIEVLSFGTFEHYMFYGNYLIALPTDLPSTVTTMDYMFGSGMNDYNQDLSMWNTTNVTSMFATFKYMYNCNLIVDGWDTSNVTDMARMFEQTDLVNFDIRNWDTSSVTSMSNMFISARGFNQPIGGWDVSKVTDFSNMFNAAVVFNQPLNNWNTSSAITMGSMFDSASAFNQPLNNWDVHLVSEMTGMFGKATGFNQNISNWCVSLIPVEPSNFSVGAALTAPNKPVWGTCPV